jgi:hypothetical protein
MATTKLGLANFILRGRRIAEVAERNTYCGMRPWEQLGLHSCIRGPMQLMDIGLRMQLFYFHVFLLSILFTCSLHFLRSFAVQRSQMAPRRKGF